MKKLLLISALLLSFNVFADTSESFLTALMGFASLFFAFSAIAIIICVVVYVFRNIGDISQTVAKNISKAEPNKESAAYAAGLKTKKIIKKFTNSELEQLSEIDDIYYEQANKELEENNRNQGLWIKVGILADGSSSKQKTEYIKQRAKQLSDQDKK